jgi:hypothetical protein
MCVTVSCVACVTCVTFGALGMCDMCDLRDCLVRDVCDTHEESHRRGDSVVRTSNIVKIALPHLNCNFEFVAT